MGLTTALSSAISGLYAAQAAMEVTAGNVANAGTVGYTRKTLNQSASVAGGRTFGVNAGQVQRQLDLAIQTQYRAQLGQGQAAALRSDFLSRLDRLFGTPGGATSLDTLFAGFTASLQALAATPESTSARVGTLAAAGGLVQQLNALSDSIQSMRQEAEAGIASAVRTANEALAGIDKLNQQIRAASAAGSSPAPLLDERDRYLDTLAGLLDVRVAQRLDGTVAIATANGTSLLDSTAAVLSFDAQPGINPAAIWSAEPASRGVGTLTVSSGSGSIDLFARGNVPGGAIGAYRDLRDGALVEAQSQIDAFAAQMSLALSNDTVTGTASSVGPATGFDLDLAGLQAGNPVTLDYREMPAGTARRVTFVPVGDATGLPLADGVTADPSDRVVGLDLSGGMAGMVAAIQTALGGSFAVSTPSGSILRILDDGAAGTVDIDGLSASITVTGMSSGSMAFPFFVDAAPAGLFTGRVGPPLQETGFAARIRINPVLAADPSALVAYASGVLPGDPARPDALLARLTGATATFAPRTGLGSASQPYRGSLRSYVGDVLAYRGSVAEAGQQRHQAQEAVVQSLQMRLDASSGVNIDQEMAHLVELQTAYSANARILTAIREMMDTLMRI